MLLQESTCLGRCYLSRGPFSRGTQFVRPQAMQYKSCAWAFDSLLGRLSFSGRDKDSYNKDKDKDSSQDRENDSDGNSDDDTDKVNVICDVNTNGSSNSCERCSCYRENVSF